MRFNPEIHINWIPRWDRFYGLSRAEESLWNWRAGRIEASDFDTDWL